MASHEAGEELGYPSMVAAVMAAALVILLSATAGRFLIRNHAVENFVTDWLPFLSLFFELLPDWAREMPWVFGGLALVSIIAVRLLAGALPRMGINLLTVAVLGAIVLLVPVQLVHLPTGPEDWAFVCYVTLTAFLGGAPRTNELNT